MGEAGFDTGMQGIFGLSLPRPGNKVKLASLTPCPTLIARLYSSATLPCMAPACRPLSCLSINGQPPPAALACLVPPIQVTHGASVVFGPRCISKTSLRFSPCPRCRRHVCCQRAGPLFVVSSTGPLSHSFAETLAFR